MDLAVAINADSIPFISKDVVIRKDDNGKLLFQIQTDEMYFVSEPTYALVNMLDGSNTIKEILEKLAQENKQFASADGQKRVFEFLEELEKRAIIECWI